MIRSTFTLANTIPHLSREDGRAFDLHGFDLSEYSTVFREPLVVHVQGRYLGGGKILAILRTDGVVDGSNGNDDDFEHFALGAPWRNLESVSFVAIHGFALDNLELTDTNYQVPALSATSQLITAAAISALALLWRIRGRHGLLECRLGVALTRPQSSSGSGLDCLSLDLEKTPRVPLPRCRSANDRMWPAGAPKKSPIRAANRIASAHAASLRRLFDRL